MLKLGYIFVFLCTVLVVHRVTGSAWLQDPPSRSAAWYYQIKAPVNYNFRNIDCGGVPVKIEADGSRNCGLCGDPYLDPIPRANEAGGKYANPRIRTRYYESGQVADISIWNNLPGSPGFYEFRLCDESQETQACFDKHLLTIVGHDGGPNSTAMSVPQTQGLNIIHLQLPVGVKCEYCTLQWRFRKENSAEGCDDKDWCGVGRGPQIEFYNCADVMIGAVGQPKPDSIQDPTYSDADYGSAYDIATTRNDATTPDGSNLDGTTTRGNVVTIPTAFPTTTAPVTSGPVTTAAPQPAPTTTAASNRLVFDDSGNQIGSTYGSNSNSGNRRLLLMLSLLPLLGMAALRNNPQPLPIPPVVPQGYLAQNVPLSNMYLGTSFGYGSFGGNGLESYGSGYGKSGSYGSKGISYGNTLSTGKVYNPPYQQVSGGVLSPNLNTQQQLLNTVIGNGNVISSGSGGLTGSGTFVTNPVIWNNGGVSINQGLQNHVIYPRSTVYQHQDTNYGPSGAFPLPATPHNYGTTKKEPYGPVPFPNPPPPTTFQQTPASWPNSIGINRNNNFNNINNINPINTVGTGQRFPNPSSLPAPTQKIVPLQNQPSSTNVRLPQLLAPVDSASRFQVMGPQQRFETETPLNTASTSFLSNGNQGNTINIRNSWNTRSNNIAGNLNRGNSLNRISPGSLQVNDWYQLLMRNGPDHTLRLV